MENISIMHANNTRPYKVEISAFIAMYIYTQPNHNSMKESLIYIFNKGRKLDR